MKLIISESLRDNLNMLIPVETMSCNELMRGFLTPTLDRESEFSRHCQAARFIFDDVTTFSIDQSQATDENVHLIRTLQGIPTTNDDDSLMSRAAWLDRARAELDDEDRAGHQIDEILARCLPSDTVDADLIILSPDPFITAQQVRQGKSLSKESMLYLLATAGIDISLPSLIAKNRQEIDTLREMFAEERVDYLLYLHKSLDELLSEANSASPDIDAIYQFAREKFALELKLKSQKIAAVVKKKGKSAWKSILTEFLGQAPTIGASVFKLDMVGGGQALFKVLLGAANGERDSQKVLSDYKEAAYLYRISAPTV